jgi:hypothetical protein
MTWLNSYQRARILLLLGSIVCFCLNWWAAAFFGIPARPGFNGSLFLQPSIVSTLLVIAVLLATGVLIGTVVAGMIRFNAGLLISTLALAAFSIRGGSSRSTLFAGLSTVGSPQLFLRFMIETIVLTLLVGLCWTVLRALHAAGTLKDREGSPTLTPAESAHETSGILIQLIITALGILLLAQSDAKQQVLAAVFIASFAGSAISHTTFSTGPRSWYWLPPLVVGMAGYLIAYVTPPAGVATADLRGLTAALARPLPLDYASMGPAGAILGHWMSRRWQKEREAMNQAAAQTNGLNLESP